MASGFKLQFQGVMLFTAEPLFPRDVEIYSGRAREFLLRLRVASPGLIIHVLLVLVGREMCKKYSHAKQQCSLWRTQYGGYMHQRVFLWALVMSPLLDSDGVCSVRPCVLYMVCNWSVLGSTLGAPKKALRKTLGNAGCLFPSCFRSLACYFVRLGLADFSRTLTCGRCFP